MGDEGREEAAGAGADELLLMLQMKQMISPLSLSPSWAVLREVPNFKAH